MINERYTSLNQLKLDSFIFNDQDLDNLSAIRANGALTVLHLEDCFASKDSIAKKIGPFIADSSLKELVFSQYESSLLEVSSIIPFFLRAHSLELLNFDGQTRLNKNQMFDMLPQTSIRTLSLKRIGMTDHDVQVLLETIPSTFLESIDISDNGEWSPAVEEEFRRFRSQNVGLKLNTE